MKKVNIMLVEDAREYREALKLALNDEPDLELVNIYGAAEVALRALHADSDNEAPDIILLDISLPGLSGIKAIGALSSCCPDARIIMLTQSSREADVLRAVQLGAAGYLLKSSSLDDIIQGIRTVMAGGASLDRGVAQYLMQALHKKPKNMAGDFKASKREVEILGLLSEGLLKKQIADKLKISENTVADHIKRIYKKLKVKNAPAAVTQAFHRGILSAKNQR